LPGVDRIWLPGEQSFEKHARYAAGGFPVSQAARRTECLALELRIAPLTRWWRLIASCNPSAGQMINRYEQPTQIQASVCKRAGRCAAKRARKVRA